MTHFADRTGRAERATRPADNHPRPRRERRIAAEPSAALAALERRIAALRTFAREGVRLNAADADALLRRLGLS